eukprot:COSAG01_NODE_4368_length_5092_cov_3.378730_3_plen_65_part_01
MRTAGRPAAQAEAPPFNERDCVSAGQFFISRARGGAAAERPDDGAGDGVVGKTPATDACGGGAGG